MGFLLSIAGFDPTGGAGVLRDVRTFNRFGFLGAAIITVNTVQNTKGVRSFEFVNGSFLISQLEAVLEEISPKGVKVGIPHRELPVNEKIAELLSSLSVPVVFDPVLSPTFGKEFFEDITVFQPLIEVSSLVTPNYSEFQRLKEFLKGKSFVVKGVPTGSEVCDFLFVDGKEAVRLCHERDDRVVRGTGCAFSSALTALLAKGLNVEEVFRRAVQFISEYRKRAFRLEGALQLYSEL